MKAFEIGYVPKGWTRGQPLLLIKASPHLRGRLTQHYTLETLPPVGSGSIAPNDVAALDFSYEEAPRVNAWLKWWHE